MSVGRLKGIVQCYIIILNLKETMNNLIPTVI